jgi:hypothetical protein
MEAGLSGAADDGFQDLPARGFSGKSGNPFTVGLDADLGRFADLGSVVVARGFWLLS